MQASPPDEAFVQLATSVPKWLHRKVKLHCVQSEQTVMQFVIEALRDKLGNSSRPAGKAPVRR